MAPPAIRPVLLDCPCCRLTVSTAAFVFPPVVCPGCSAPLLRRCGGVAAGDLEKLLGVVYDAAFPTPPHEGGERASRLEAVPRPGSAPWLERTPLRPVDEAAHPANRPAGSS